jgi:hypothetical protein
MRLCIEKCGCKVKKCAKHLAILDKSACPGCETEFDDKFASYLKNL